MKKLLFLSVLFMISFTSVNATEKQSLKTQTEDTIKHSGRTNTAGCHYDRINGGYHCH